MNLHKNICSTTEKVQWLWSEFVDSASLCRDRVARTIPDRKGFRKVRSYLLWCKRVACPTFVALQYLPTLRAYSLTLFIWILFCACIFSYYVPTLWPCAVILCDCSVWLNRAMAVLCVQILCADKLHVITLYDKPVWWSVSCMSNGLESRFSTCLCCLCHSLVSVSPASVSASHSLISNSLYFCQF